MPLRRLIPCLSLMTALLLVAPPSAAQSAADVAAARELFKEAAQLSKEERWEEAKERLTRSLALKAAPITHFSLGIAQMKTGELVEALESLRAFLIAPPEPGTQKYRPPAEKAVSELEGRVAKVVITVEPADVAGLTLRIDDVDVPVANVGRERLANPGSHTVTVAAPGYHDATGSFDVEEGASATLSLTLEPAPEQAKPDGTTDSSADGGAEERGFPVGPVVLMSIGAAAAGAGIAVGMIGLSKAEDAPTNDGEEADSARQLGLVGDIVAGAGGAIGAAGLIWLIVHLTSDGDTVGDEAAVRPWCLPGGGGVQLSL